ncbi:MAG: TlpA disulfide reductase family protein [Polyangiaceae bacterium]
MRRRELSGWGGVLGAALIASVMTGCSGGGGKANNADGESSSSASTTSTGTVATQDSPPPKGNAPDFTLPLLDGGNASLSDYTGKHVVLVDFWSTTCQPCLEEMPHMVALYEKFKAKGLVILGVAGDDSATRSRVSAVIHDNRVGFPILLDEDTSVIVRFNPSKLMPFWVLIDKNGNIVKKKSGYDPGDEKVLEAEVEKLLQ